MQLREWQQQLQNAIVHGHPMPKQALRAGSIDGERQLAIYRNAYWLRLAEALRSNYPALHQLLGDDDFDVLAQGYLRAHPSQHASIRWFGDRLGDYLLRTEPFAQVPAMAELAQFEWALRHSIDAADATRVTLDAMATVAPEDWSELTFDLHPSLSLLTLQWNAPAVWKALTSAQEPPAPQAQHLHWLIWRDENQLTQWRSADDDEAGALQRLQRGETFSALCEFAAQLHGEERAAITAAGWLKLWITQGVLIHRAN